MSLERAKWWGKAVGSQESYWGDFNTCFLEFGAPQGLVPGLRVGTFQDRAWLMQPVLGACSSSVRWGQACGSISQADLLAGKVKATATSG